MNVLNFLDDIDDIIPRPRHFKDKSNPLKYFSDDEFLYRFRVSKESANLLVAMIQLQNSSFASTALLPIQKLVITLNY